MPKLEDLELKVKQTTPNTQALKGLASALSDLGKESRSLGTIPSTIRKISEALNTVPKDSAAAVKGIASAMVTLKNTAQYSSTIASSVRQVSGALKELTDKIDADKISKIASAMEAIKSASKSSRIGTAIKAATAQEKAAEATDWNAQSSEFSEANKTDEVMDASWKKVESFRKSNRAYLNSIKESVKESGKLASAMKKVGSATKSLVGAGWERLSNRVKSLTGVFSNLAHSFARIAMYRALRTAIKAITQGFAEGIKHLYEWSRVMDNTFKNSMDSLSTSAHYLRDSLGAMASPLIDALAPAVEFVVEKFVSLLNVVNQFIATFTGASSWRRAVRTPTEYSSGLEDAAKSAKKATEAQKKLNKALMDFDELNLITTSTTKGSNPSSPSGSGGGEDYSTHFVEEPIADWIQAIKNAIDNGDWYGAGKLLADHLNGIIDAWDARAWGEKLGEKVENGLKFYLGFMDNFKWGTLGIKAGDFINGVLSKIDPNDLGRAMVAHVKAGLKFLANFAWTVDLSPLGTAFGVAFNELFSKDTMNDLAMTISGFVNNAIGIAYNFVTTADWAEMGKNVMQAIFTAIGNIEWGTAGATVGKLATGLLDAVLNALDYAISHIDVILQAVYDFAAELLGHLWNWLVDKVSGLLKEFWNYVKEHFFDSGVDDGNGRKDSRDLGMTPFSQTTTNPDPIEQDYIVNYKSNNYNTMKAQRAVLSANVSPTVIWTESGYKKVLEHRTALGKQISTTVKFKPVVETSANKGTTTSLLSSKQLSKLLDLRAEGGFPNLTQGSMFIGGERPGEAEMVGNIHGKTGVASGKEITGIADAVYNTGETEAELLRQQNSLLRQLLAKNTSVTLAPTAAAGKWVSQAQTAYARATG